MSRSRHHSTIHGKTAGKRNEAHIPKFALNSLIVAAGTVPLTLVTGSMAAFARGDRLPFLQKQFIAGLTAGAVKA